MGGRESARVVLTWLVSRTVTTLPVSRLAQDVNMDAAMLLLLLAIVIFILARVVVSRVELPGLASLRMYCTSR